MVLTQLLLLLLILQSRFGVSIPLWFSRNPGEEDNSWLADLCFHTTMVLTQLGGVVSGPVIANKFPYHYGSHATRPIKVRPISTNNVSIPLWFSRNEDDSNEVDEVLTCFHTTMVLTQPIYSSSKDLYTEKVSIPLWFSRNTPRRASSSTGNTPFPYHYGSHATK